eukprot:SAG11_NODE_32040_length_287_cov_0.356383_2_plen_55_part_01
MWINTKTWVEFATIIHVLQAEVVKLLLDGGADLKRTDSRGFTPLMDVSAAGHLAI